MINIAEFWRLRN